MKRIQYIIGSVLLILLTAGVCNAQMAPPWTGKYPMSLFTKTRTANTVGKGRLSVCLKTQTADSDEMLVDGCYEDMPDTDRSDTVQTVFTAKYGWAKDHHLALGIPYMWVDFKSPSAEIKKNGLGNVFLFEKWKWVRETEDRPGVAFDAWYYFPTGDENKKLGSEDASIKLTTEISKAWRTFSLHLNPGYAWNLDDGCDVAEINAAVLYNHTPKLMLGMEYNYTDKDDKGDCHDIVPGFVWKFAKDATFKLGAVVNIDSSMKYRDELGTVSKLFYKF